MSADQSALNTDGTLKDASEIQWYDSVKTRSTPELSPECLEISVRWDLASVTRRGALHPCQVFVPDFGMRR